MKKIYKKLYLRKAFKLWSLFCCFLAAASLCGCGKNSLPVSRTGFYFDTVITLTLYDTAGLSTARTEEIFTECFQICETYEAMFSRTREGSDIWNINHAQGHPVQVTAETADLLAKALSYCEATDGAVDVTVAPLSDLWDFSSESLGTKTAENALPAPAQIADTLSHVNYQKVSLEGTTVTLSDPGAALDLGCIAKGFIADRLKDYLSGQGIDSALINLGGNLLALGNRPDGSPFRLGIQKPFDMEGTPIAVLTAADVSLVSSGVYERYFTLDGIRYHHLFNTRTGMPEDNGLLSVTIVTESSADADILSTACFLLGLEKGMAYAESLPGVEAVFVTEDFALHPSSGLSGMLQNP